MRVVPLGSVRFSPLGWQNHLCLVRLSKCRVTQSAHGDSRPSSHLQYHTKIDQLSNYLRKNLITSVDSVDTGNTSIPQFTEKTENQAVAPTLLIRTCLHEVIGSYFHARKGHIRRLGHHLNVTNTALATTVLGPHENHQIQVARQVLRQLQCHSK